MLNFMNPRETVPRSPTYDGDDSSVSSDDGTVNISSTTYADKCKKLMDVTKSLRDMG